MVSITPNKGYLISVTFVILIIVVSGISMLVSWQKPQATICSSDQQIIGGWTVHCQSYNDKYEYLSAQKSDGRVIKVSSGSAYASCGSLAMQVTVEKIPVYAGNCNGNLFVSADTSQNVVLYEMNTHDNYKLSFNIDGKQFAVVVDKGAIQ